MLRDSFLLRCCHRGRILDVTGIPWEAWYQPGVLERVGRVFTEPGREILALWELPWIGKEKSNSAGSKQPITF